MAKDIEKNGRQGEGGGAPEKSIDEEQIIQVEALAAVLTKEQLANYFGMCENTFREIEKRQPEVFEAYQRGRIKAIAGVSTNLISKARKGNITAMIFYLKTQAGWSEKKAIELTNPDGSLSPHRELTDEELKKELERRSLPTSIFD